VTFDQAENEANVVKLAGPRKSNQEIIDGLRRGSPEAAAALYDQYGALVNRLVWRFLGADPDHDDVVHQVFVAVLTSIGTVSNPLVLGAWISGVTFNTVSKEIRSRKYRRILHLVPEQPEIPSTAMAPDRQAFIRRFYAIVDRMRTDDRLMFVLRFLEGHTVIEIAGITKASPATVKRRIARARQVFMKRARKDEMLSDMIEDIEHEG